MSYQSHRETSTVVWALFCLVYVYPVLDPRVQGGKRSPAWEQKQHGGPVAPQKVKDGGGRGRFPTHRPARRRGQLLVTSAEWSTT